MVVLPQILDQELQRPDVSIKAPPVRVLLVEDCDGDAMLERISLNETFEGPIAITRASTLRAAMRLLEDQDCDVAVVDLSLPDAWGGEIIEKLRLVAPDLPLVVVTGNDDPRAVDHVMRMGAQDFVHKDELGGNRLSRAVRLALLRSRSAHDRDGQDDRRAVAPELMHRELDAARRMQMALLPRSEEIEDFGRRHGVDVAGLLEPSLAVGGDLWGSMEIGDGRIGVYAFDFSGHGIAAALNTFRLHTLIHDHHELAHAPDALLSRLDATLAPLLPMGQFATIFYAVMDLWENTLTWSSAGAPAPLFMPKDGLPERLDSSGFLLGLQSDPRRESLSRTMNPGDSLLLFSDAVTECVDPAGQFLTDDEITSMAQSARGCANSQSRLDHFVSALYGRTHAPMHDDLTVVWVSRAEGQAGAA